VFKDMKLTTKRSPVHFSFQTKEMAEVSSDQRKKEQLDTVISLSDTTLFKVKAITFVTFTSTWNFQFGMPSHFLSLLIVVRML
jgi:hypothetical protein